MYSLKKIKILDVGVTSEKRSKILEFILEQIQLGHAKFYIVTPNPEIILQAHKNKAFMQILNNAQISLCDGIGLKVGAKLLGRDMLERISGVDFMENLCELASKNKLKIGFLGGRDSVAEKASERLKAKFRNLQVKIAVDEWNTKYNSLDIDILFVAFGFPKQETWMAENLDKTQVKVMMGVGGSFDYISGKVARAPKFLRSIGLEWLFRLIRQPWRIKRQVIGSQFFTLILLEKFKKIKLF